MMNWFRSVLELLGQPFVWWQQELGLVARLRNYCRRLILCYFSRLYQGVPEAATLTVRTDERGVFKLTWTEPEANGFPITNYTIYTKLVSGNENSGEWKLAKTVNKDVLSDTLTLEAEGRYQIVVTAANKIGEAKKEDGKIQTVEVPAGEWPGDVCCLILRIRTRILNFVQQGS